MSFITTIRSNCFEITLDRMKMIQSTSRIREENMKLSSFKAISILIYLNLIIIVTSSATNEVFSLTTNVTSAGPSLAEVESTAQPATLLNVTSMIEGHLNGHANLTTFEPKRSQQQARPTSSSVLRPSIEEVASELSRKYLNLEHDNWRLKQATNPSVSKSLDDQTPISTGRNVTEFEPPLPSSLSSDIAVASVDSEKVLTSRWNNEMASNKNGTVSSGGEYATKVDGLEQVTSKASIFPAGGDTSAELQPKWNDEPNKQNQEDFFATKANERPFVSTFTSPQSKKTAPNRRKKMDTANHQANELSQCQLYLQLHSPSGGQQSNLLMVSPATMDVAAGSLRPPQLMTTSQQLPCSCEFRRPYTSGAVEFDSTGGVWLSCDHVQLIGSHLYSPPTQAADQQNSSHRAQNQDSSTIDDIDLYVSKFSQRDSGLQVIQSQKFHFLQLNNLKYLDLGDNRIRQIKLDAFHGIETKLEYLNLANNLLGDGRFISTSAPNTNANVHYATSNRNEVKQIFSSDELNNLINLKWLSLKNNHIRQLAPNIFIKYGNILENDNNNLLVVSSKLEYLDLSENLLKFVPSESIEHLNKLERLNLKQNQIEQLNQFSKFPKSLKYLDLSENMINTIRKCDLIDLSDLIELDLSNNQLSQLDQSAFVSASLLSSSPSSSLDLNNLLQNQSKNRFGEISERTKRDTSNEQQDVNDEMAKDTSTSDSDTNMNIENDEDLEANDSILSALKSSFGQSREETLRKQEISSNNVSSQANDFQTDINFSSHLRQFNATLKLNLSYNLLESIPGDSLLRFPNLQQLDLSFNRIRRLDANYLCSIYNLVDNLRSLDLSGNLLSVVQQQQQQQQLQQTKNRHPNATQEEEKSFQLNKLFGCFQKLEKLLLSTNQLASLTNNRESLVLSNQRPVDYTESNSDYVNNAYDHQASNILEQPRLVIKFGEGFASSRHLKTLDLSDNQLKLMPKIEHIPIQPIALFSVFQSTIMNNQSRLNQWLFNRVHLERLDLKFNYIERIDEHDLEHLIYLRQLNLDHNKLASLPSKFLHKLTSLDTLTLGSNRLTSIEPLNEMFERSSKTLKHLDLSNNRLLEWPAITISTISAAPKSFDELTSFVAPASNNFDIKQKYNNLRLINGKNNELVVQLPSFALEELNLEGNLMTSTNISPLFEQLAYMKSLKVLNLSYNLLHKIKSEWFKFANENLQKLSFTGNKINTIDLGSFALNQINELVQLDLNFNLLKELNRKTFDSLPKLRKLNLGNNLIHTINSETFNQINSLQILKLNNNKLTSWKCEYFSHLCNSISGYINVDLDTLFASFDQQNQTTKATAFSSLIELDLSHNLLSQLRTNSISVHTKLIKLDLSYNKLSFIPHDFFKAITASSPTLGRQIQLLSSLKYLNLAYNRIQTIDNINFKPLKNLVSLDLSFNELQAIGNDVILIDSTKREQNNRKIYISNHSTNLLLEDEIDAQLFMRNKNQKMASMVNNWPALNKLRHLNLAGNQITLVNQSILNELSPFALLNLNLSYNYIESDSLPFGFYIKLSNHKGKVPNQQPTTNNVDSQVKQANYDLIFTLKLESLDISHNRLNEFPIALLENHHTSMESCNLSHNRIQNLNSNSNIMIQIKSLSLEFNPLNQESNDLILFEQRNARTLNLAATRLYAIHQATLFVDESVPFLGDHQNGPLSKRSRMVNQTSQLDLIRSISKPIEAPYLRYLNLSSNQLVWLAANVFDRLYSLQTLDLSNNQLTRLHLLSNQLTQVASSLRYLNLNSNLFTSIDANDFSQLGRLEHLDLSNFLGLQKLNCKFLNKLTHLRILKMFNYPQLRSNLNNVIATLTLQQVSDRLQRKLYEELVMSTIGEHCFMMTSENYDLLNVDSLQMSPSLNNQINSDKINLNNNHLQQVNNQLKWFKLRELELELFHGFRYDHKTTEMFESILAGFNGFTLNNELNQLIGPQIERLTIIGLNLTSLTDDSLIGLASKELQLKISYTSISHLPMKQILSSVSKRTKLCLDLRNNNIQSIDTDGLKWLDELQQHKNRLELSQFQDERSSLKLANNPFKCDCRARPVWLWLNQKLDQTIESSNESGPLNEDLTSGVNSSSSGGQVIKFSTFAHFSDLRCHYPLKLRGKLTQNVHYNDLICKGAENNQQQQSHIAPQSVQRQSKKRNDSSVLSSAASYHRAAEFHHYGEPQDPEDAEIDDEYNFDQFDQVRPANQARLTKFNRYPQALNNYSMYVFANFLSPMSKDDSGDEEEPIKSPIGKRDQSSKNSQEIIYSSNRNNHNFSQQSFNTKFSKYRPNTQQKHSHFSTLTNLNPSNVARGMHSSESARNSYLTESDIMILTLTSIAMVVMSFVIIIICLFKYRMDQNDRELILNSSGKMIIESSGLRPPELGPLTRNHRDRVKKSSSKFSSEDSSNWSSSKRGQSEQRSKQLIFSNFSEKQNSSQANQQQVLIPISQTRSILAPAAQNFLMRSPTIRRMQGFASNASDWFKFTLRAYPTKSATSRRRTMLMDDHSQLTTGQLAKHLVKRIDPTNYLDPSNGGPSKLMPVGALSLVTGCPIHSFKSLQRLVSSAGDQQQVTEREAIDHKCVYCHRLLRAIQQTQVQCLLPKKDTSRATENLEGRPRGHSSPQRPAPSRKVFEKSIEELVGQDGEYVSSQVFEELDEQLLRDDSMVVLEPGDWSERATKFRPRDLRCNLAQSRDIQTKTLRTFGVKPVQDVPNSASTSQVQSQIPTVDVDGRFAYQTESHLESPLDNYNAISSRQSDTDAATSAVSPTSTIHNPNTSVFVLVPEHLAFEASKTSDFAILNYQMNNDENGTMETNSTIRNECSHSSSPVNYDFMRSSPSVTTLSSSVNLRQKHFNITRDCNPLVKNDEHLNQKSLPPPPPPPPPPMVSYETDHQSGALEAGAHPLHTARLATTSSNSSLADNQVVISRL